MDDERICTGKNDQIVYREVSRMDNIITREEHEEFMKRMEAEDNRQNRRIEILEKTTEQIQTLTTSVEKLAMNMESMVRQMGQQGERLEALESRDGEMWRKVVGHAMTAVISIVIGYIFCRLGM